CSAWTGATRSRCRRSHRASWTRPVSRSCARGSRGSAPARERPSSHTIRRTTAPREPWPYNEESTMKRRISAMLAIGAAACFMQAQAETTVMAVRIGADDIVELAKFYETAFGFKEIDRVGNPVSEIIMRYGATVEEAKAGSSPEFLLQTREDGAAKDPMVHAIFRVSDV